MCFKKVTNLFVSKKSLLDQIKQLNQQLLEQKQQVAALQKQIADLQANKPIEPTIPIVDPLEKYWNTKRSSDNTLQYQARTLLNEDVVLAIDPRVFYEVNDNSLPIVSGSNDQKALKALKWVHDNVVYTSDSAQFKHAEEWLFAHETGKIRTGDCEDGAILIANIMLLSGIPYWRIRLNAGDVSANAVGNGIQTYIKQEGITTLQWFSQKEIDSGTIQKVLQQGLEQAKESVNKQNLRKAVLLLTKELVNVDTLYANMDGKQLEPNQEFVNNATQLINLEFITKIKIDKTTIQKIYKYYALLATLDIMGKRGILDSGKKDNLLGIKGSQGRITPTLKAEGNQKTTEGTAGHCWVTYLRESDNQWVILDWCYWFNPNGTIYHDAEKYFDIWFSWNTQYIFPDESFDRLANGSRSGPKPTGKKR